VWVDPGRRKSNTRLDANVGPQPEPVNYYAQNPQLVKTLDSAALAIALATIANRTKA